MTGPEELSALRVLVAGQTLDDSVAHYIVQLAQATRAHPDVERGASTRATLALALAARAWALWDGRDFATPSDVQEVLGPVLAHRLLLRRSVQGAYSRDEASHLLQELTRQVVAPR